MAHHTTLNKVIQDALAARGITTLRDTAAAVNLSKDAIKRRYDGEVSWTIPDLDKVAAFLDVDPDVLIARRRGAA